MDVGKCRACISRIAEYQPGWEDSEGTSVNVGPKGGGRRAAECLFRAHLRQSCPAGRLA